MSAIFTNIVALLVIVGIVGAAIRYIYKEKKKGTRCIGCPSSGTCSKGKTGTCTCHTAQK